MLALLGTSSVYTQTLLNNFHLAHFEYFLDISPLKVHIPQVVSVLLGTLHIFRYKHSGQMALVTYWARTSRTESYSFLLCTILLIFFFSWQLTLYIMGYPFPNRSPTPGMDHMWHTNCIGRLSSSWTSWKWINGLQSLYSCTKSISPKKLTLHY